MKRNNVNDSNIAKRQRGCEAEESEDEFEDSLDQFDDEKVVETIQVEPEFEKSKPTLVLPDQSKENLKNKI